MPERGVMPLTFSNFLQYLDSLEFWNLIENLNFSKLKPNRHKFFFIIQWEHSLPRISLPRALGLLRGWFLQWPSIGIINSDRRTDQTGIIWFSGPSTRLPGILRPRGPSPENLLKIQNFKIYFRLSEEPGLALAPSCCNDMENIFQVELRGGEQYRKNNGRSVVI